MLRPISVKNNSFKADIVRGRSFTISMTLTNLGLEKITHKQIYHMLEMFYNKLIFLFNKNISSLVIYMSILNFWVYNLQTMVMDEYYQIQKIHFDNLNIDGMGTCHKSLPNLLEVFFLIFHLSIHFR